MLVNCRSAVKNPSELVLIIFGRRMVSGLLLVSVDHSIQ